MSSQDSMVVDENGAKVCNTACFDRYLCLNFETGYSIRIVLYCVGQQTYRRNVLFP